MIPFRVLRTRPAERVVVGTLSMGKASAVEVEAAAWEVTKSIKPLLVEIATGEGSTMAIAVESGVVRGPGWKGAREGSWLMALKLDPTGWESVRHELAINGALQVRPLDEEEVGQLNREMEAATR